MVDLEDSIIARYESHGHGFEILIDKKVSKLIRDEKDVDLFDHMVIDEIFSDASKGTRAKEEDLVKVFGTTDVATVAKKIVADGEVQLTTQERREMAESKRKKIIALIARNAVNPQTKGPHPPQRIEIAMEEAKVRIDPFKSAEVQLDKVVDAIRPLLPISFAKVKMALKLSGPDYGRCFGDIQTRAVILKEEWTNDGSWIGLLELPAGVRQELEEILNNKTRGNVDVRNVDK